MSNTTLPQPPTPTDDQIDRILDAMADAFVHQLRSPIMHTPSEQNLAYEDVTFPSLDGVPLEGWFIPADGSEKLIIAELTRYRWSSDDDAGRFSVEERLALARLR
jgi:hypothetical protein